MGDENICSETIRDVGFPFSEQEAILSCQSQAMELLNLIGAGTKCAQCSKIYYHSGCFGYHAAATQCKLGCLEDNFDWMKSENYCDSERGYVGKRYVLKFRKSCPLYKNRKIAKVVKFFQNTLKKIEHTLKYFLEWFSSLKQGTQVIIILAIVFVFCSRDFFNSIVTIFSKLH